jgi:pimeloyl-ACP methyl ester carboxylesterase
MTFRYDDGSFYQQRVVDQHLDSLNKRGPSFRLYYFVTDLTYNTNVKPGGNKPTILFVAGGPGQIVTPEVENFADIYGYRTVYFHLRGTGLSQIPQDFDADQFLRTFYVVEDMEKIRKDLMDEDPWSAVVGHSYGAIVAQAYAAHHQYGRRVEKVVLSAPMAPIVSLRSERSTGERQGFESLRRIYRRNEFRFLKRLGDDPDKLVDETQDISTRIEKLAGKVQYVADNYRDLEKRLASENLNHGAAFYGAIRRLRQVGWLPLDVPLAKPIRTAKVDDTQVQCGLVIAKALSKNKSGFKRAIKGVLKEQLDDAQSELGNPSTQNSDRAFWIFSVIDGLNVEFLRNLRAANRTAAITALGGESKYNPALSKLLASLTHSGLLQESAEFEAWDPAKLTHDKRTLILKGGADPVTENGEAEYYFEKALIGKRVLMEFPGIGHSMALPEVPVAKRNILKVSVGSNLGGAKRFLSTRDALIDSFLDSKSVAEFKAQPIVRVLKETFEACFDDLINNRSLKETEREELKILPE